MTPERWNRIVWRCRRGMLENDLVLTRFLESKERTMSEEELVILDRLLDLADGDLWDLIAGRSEPGDPRIRPLLEQLRIA